MIGADASEVAHRTAPSPWCLAAASLVSMLLFFPAIQDLVGSAWGMDAYSYAGYYLQLASAMMLVGTATAMCYWRQYANTRGRAGKTIASIGILLGVVLWCLGSVYLGLVAFNGCLFSPHAPWTCSVGN